MNFSTAHLDALLRSLVLHRMVSFDNQKTLDEAQARFLAHTSGKATIHADLRSAVYKAVLSAGDGNTYQTMLKVIFYFSSVSNCQFTQICC